jgi:Skp family chaperone for outer membrane proteins
MKLMSMLAAATAVVLGQDAGVVPRSTAPDGGVPVATTAQPGQPQTVVVDRTAEIQALREELHVMQATAQETNAKLDAAVSELRQVKAQLADQQRSQEQQRAQRETQKEAAVQLSAVDQRLATGDTTVSALMNTLQGQLGPAAQLNLDYARTALANNDIASARMYLAQAMLEAQAGH